MTAQHSQEPWRVSVFDHAVADSYGSFVILRDSELSETDARRIVACVNACAGISTKNLDAVLYSKEPYARLLRLSGEASRAAQPLIDANANE